MAAQGPATPSALYKMISIPEAQKVVLTETECLPSVPRPLSEAQGCILAEDVHAAENMPPFPASIKAQCLLSGLQTFAPAKALSLESSAGTLLTHSRQFGLQCCEPIAVSNAGWICCCSIGRSRRVCCCFFCTCRSSTAAFGVWKCGIHHYR